MVQFKRYAAFDNAQLLHDDYWKLKSPTNYHIGSARAHMVQRGFHCPASRKGDAVRDLFQRMQRGHLSYDACSVAELRQFGKARRLTSGAGDQLKTKAGIVMLLQQADDDATFDRFTELPAEMRARIYTMHFDDLEMSFTPGQPPITRVSRQTRAEAVPLFYSTCRFEVQINQRRNRFSEYDRGRWVHYPNNDYVVALHRATAQFFSRIQDADVCRITKLHVNITFATGAKVGWDIDLRLSLKDVEVVRYDAVMAKHMQSYVSRRDKDEEQADTVTLRLRDRVRTIMARTVAHKLRREDAAFLKSAFEDPRAQPNLTAK